jgi:adenosine deaminase
VLDLAAEHRIEVPAGEVEKLADWFDQTGSGSLETYLQAFTVTIALMQTADALERVAYEALVDVAEAGVVHAEVRFGPSLHTAGELGRQRVVEAVVAGLRRGESETGTTWGLILCALRQMDDSEAVARLALQSRHLGVVAFDLAGPERNYPPDRHLAACRLISEAGLGLTLHAGEAAGLASIATAVGQCRAERLGHGIEIIEDCRVEEGRIADLGPVAARVRDRRIPLEICIRSNLATKGWSPDQHPVGLLHRAGFAVTLNTDNRLMSRTSMPIEFELAAAHHGFSTTDLAGVTRNALAAAYLTESRRRSLWEERIAPAYLEAGAEISQTW